MDIKEIRRKQIRKLIRHVAASPVHELQTPSQGWIAAMRTALGMSGAQLGKRLRLSRARISQAEKAEVDGGVTLRTMTEMADAMGGRFVYAIVPKHGDVDDIIKAQARRKAAKLVTRVSTHMALEKQSLDDEMNNDEIDRITSELIRNPPKDFWISE